MPDASMREILDIVAAYENQSAARRRCALAMVADVKGSAFRRPGARMLVGAGPRILAGCISGGCLDADAAQWAHSAIQGAGARVVTYRNRADSAADRLLGLGGGCDGTVRVLIAALAERSDPTIAILRAIAESRAPWALASEIAESSARLGAAAAVAADSDAVHEAGAGANDDLASAARLALRRRTSLRLPLGAESGSAAVLAEYFAPRIRLTIFGAGAGASTLARIADEMGWLVEVCDHRAGQCDPGRFPASSEIHVGRPESLRDEVRPDPFTACIVMTHDYGMDIELLHWLSESAAFYVGVLGSRRRLGQIQADLAAMGCDLRARLGERLHAPVGLDFGPGADPAGIALSIAAEIQAESASRPASQNSQNRARPPAHVLPRPVPGNN